MIPALGLGLVVGIVLGVVGGGGSIIAVPALVYGVGMSPAQAIPTSLLVVGVSSLAALLPRVRDGLNWPVIALVGAAGIPAAWGGAAVGRLLDPNILMLAFAAIMVAAGIRMLRKPRESGGSCSTGPGRAFRSCAPKAVGVGLLVGFLTGMLGVGGGFLITPALTIFLGLRMKQAVGTSLAIIVINSAAGFSAHAAGYTIDWAATLAFAVPAILGSLVAARLARRLKEAHIRISFAVLIFAVAAWVTAGTVTA
ncbi:MAG TPA: sulfite exporter TauE/SafE family protein [Arthrobacter sp.]